MISKVNNSPSFGMAFKQEKVLGQLMPMKEKALRAYSAAASGIDNLSSTKEVDVFLKGIEKAREAVEGAPDPAGLEPVIDSFKLKITGRGENPVNVVRNISADEMPKDERSVNKFFKNMRSDIGKIGILSEIKEKFGI